MFGFKAFKDFFCHVWKTKEGNYSLNYYYCSLIIAHSCALCFLAFSELGVTKPHFHCLYALFFLKLNKSQL